jgi:Spy/CpxP family protein refolding chaperone
MKRIIVSVLAIALTVTAVQAQEIPERKHDGVHRQEGHKKHHSNEMADLNLSEEQKTKFKALNQEQHKQIAELKKQDNITVKESRERMEELRKDHLAKVQALLTPEQKAKLEKKKEERKTKMGEMGKARGERMKKELNLTDEQSAKLDAGRKQISEKMQSIRDDKSLTEEQVKEKSKELRKEQMKSMKSILTEEQFNKMKESRKHHGRKKMDV